MSGTTTTLAPLIADHLWQSTLFAGAIWLLTLAFRRHRADVRFALWLAASMKFVVPFATLVTIGASFGWTEAPLPPPALRLAIDTAAQPFSPVPRGPALAAQSISAMEISPWLAPRVEGMALRGLATIWALGAIVLLGRWSMGWRRLHRLVRGGTQMHEGREIRLLRQHAPELSLVVVNSVIEPGVVGIFRPVLIWPSTISDRLDDDQIVAIFAHEAAHVRRRDNLSAALHMVVEAAFWFHPLVWWLRSRLVDERERACDEAVLRAGREPRRYAESILRTCEFYLESPLPCVTGVTGADLKRRIETIMRNRPAAALGRASALLLSCCAIITVAAPIGLGIMRGPRLLAAQSPPGGGARFDAVSVKRNTSGAQGGTNQNTPGRYVATNISLRMLIRGAYGVLDSQLVSGPALATADYMSAEKFDIVATYAGDVTREQRNEMMQNMLKDRFKLVAHSEMREMPVYVLSIARSDGRLGAAIKPESEECAARRAGPGQPPGQPPAAPPVAGGVRGAGPGTGPDTSTVRCGALQFGPGSFLARGVGLDMLTDSLANRTPITGIDRIVLDRTGLTGRYDYELKWTPAGRAGGPAPAADDPDRPSIFTALQEQLGLKLEAQRAPVEVLVIDSAQLPTEN